MPRTTRGQTASEAPTDPIMDLQNLPACIFVAIIERLVKTVGIFKAVRLRPVSSKSELHPEPIVRIRSTLEAGNLHTTYLEPFNAAILHAICISQVIGIDDTCIPGLPFRISPLLKSHIFLARPYSSNLATNFYVETITEVNKAMDRLIPQTEKDRYEQHRVVAEAVATIHSYEFEKRRTRFLAQTIADGAATDNGVSRAHNILCGAIVLGNLPLVESLLRAPGVRPSINSKAPFFGRPLQLAAVWGHLHIVRFLLERGADPCDGSVDLQDGESLETPILSLLSQRSSSGSALRAAALGGHEDIVRLLLEPGYRTLISDIECTWAIMAAVRGGYTRLCRLLIRGTGKSLSDERLAGYIRYIAAQFGREDIVRMALGGRDVYLGTLLNSYIRRPRPISALHAAAEAGYAGIIRLLLDYGTDIDDSFDWSSPAQYAAYGGHQEAVELLLERGATPADAMIAAVRAGEVRLFKWLLARYPNPLRIKDAAGRPVGMELLKLAIVNMNPDIITLLVEAGVPLNDDYPYGDFPIVIAKMNAPVWVVDTLLSLGAEDRGFHRYGRPSYVGTDKYPYSDYRRIVRNTPRTWQWLGKY